MQQFKLESSFSTWLICIGINESLARLKEKGKLYHIRERAENFKDNFVIEIRDNKELNPQDRMIRK